MAGCFEGLGDHPPYCSVVLKCAGCAIKVLREDKGGEYMSKEFDDFCAEHGIQRQHSVRARPQQNGVAERANRTYGAGHYHHAASGWFASVLLG